MAGISILKKYPGLSTLLILEMLVFLLVSYQIQLEGHISLLEKLAMTVIGPFQSASHHTLVSLVRFSEERQSLESLQSENNELKERLVAAENTETRLTELRKQNERLLELLALEQRPGWHYIFAEVIGRSHRHDDYMIMINKGTRHGLLKDQGVICPQGVIGTVWEAGGRYAKILTINNPGSTVAALVQQSRFQESYVVGTGNTRGRLENFPNYEPIARQDLVLTSGLDRIFPKGLHIGRVLHALPSSYLSQEVEIKFSTDFSRLEEVIILIPKALEDKDELD